eukprot:m51a1_g2442 putative domain containing protein (1553) ;mRNA; r:861225-867164
MNTLLARRALRITNLSSDFADGVALINLLEILTGKVVGRYTRRAHFLPQKLDNINVAIHFIETTLGFTVIATGNLKQSMGLVFFLLQKFPNATATPSAPEPPPRPAPPAHSKHQHHAAAEAKAPAAARPMRQLPQPPQKHAHRLEPPELPPKILGPTSPRILADDKSKDKDKKDKEKEKEREEKDKVMSPPAPSSFAPAIGVQHERPSSAPLSPKPGALVVEELDVSPKLQRTTVAVAAGKGVPEIVVQAADAQCAAQEAQGAAKSQLASSSSIPLSPRADTGDLSGAESTEDTSSCSDGETRKHRKHRDKASDGSEKKHKHKKHGKEDESTDEGSPRSEDHKEKKKKKKDGEGHKKSRDKSKSPRETAVPEHPAPEAHAHPETETEEERERRLQQEEEEQYLRQQAEREAEQARRIQAQREAERALRKKREEEKQQLTGQPAQVAPESPAVVTEPAPVSVSKKERSHRKSTGSLKKSRSEKALSVHNLLEQEKAKAERPEKDYKGESDTKERKSKRHTHKHDKSSRPPCPADIAVVYELQVANMAKDPATPPTIVQEPVVVNEAEYTRPEAERPHLVVSQSATELIPDREKAVSPALSPSPLSPMAPGSASPPLSALRTSDESSSVSTPSGSPTPGRLSISLTPPATKTRRSSSTIPLFNMLFRGEMPFKDRRASAELLRRSGSGSIELEIDSDHPDDDRLQSAKKIAALQHAVAVSQHLIRINTARKNFTSSVEALQKCGRVDLLVEAPKRSRVITLQLLVKLRCWRKRREHERKVEEEKKLALRNEVAHEIHKSEQSYVESLELIAEVFQKPAAQMLNDQLQRRIFSNLQIILKYNQLLLKKINERMKDWDNSDQKLGDIFSQVVKFLKVYTVYVNNYPTSFAAVQEAVESNKNFAQHLEKMRRSAECNGLEINSFLIMPIQRIPRYVLLLQDLARFTPESHPDYKELSEALKEMKSVAGYVNEKKREAENLNQVLSVQKKLVGMTENLPMPHRRFVRQGVLLELDEKSCLQSHVCFLFNDAMVLSRPKVEHGITIRWKRGSKRPLSLVLSANAKYKFERLVSLQGAGVFDMPDDEKKGLYHAFLLRVPGARSLVLSCINAEEKTAWMSDIDESASSVLQKHRQRLVVSTGNTTSPAAMRASSSPLPADAHKHAEPLAPAEALQDEQQEEVVDVEGAEYEGSVLLNKRGQWVPRYMVLKAATVYVFTGVRDVVSVDPEPLKILPVVTSHVLRVSERPHCFVVVTASRLYTVAAADAAQMQQWVWHVRNSMAPGEAFLPAAAQARLREQSSEAIVESLTSQPDNRACADCTAGGAAIMYVSLWAGVFLCTDCANAHKVAFPDKSSDIPAIRSIARTTPPAALETAVRRGNARANALLEGYVAGMKRPAANAPQALRVEYIKAKYAQSDRAKPLPSQHTAQACETQARELSPPALPSEIKMMGVLLRRKGVLARDWRRYVFVLTRTTLFYAAQPSGAERRAKQKGWASISISLCTPREPEGAAAAAQQANQPQAQVTWEIVTPFRIFIVAAETQAEKQEWLTAINDVKSRL